MTHYSDDQIEAARSVLRADYWNDVRNVVDDVKSAIERRDLTTEDEVTECIDIACDGTQRVIYTGQAIECILFTNNDEAYEEYGDLDSLGATSTGDLYSKLAYFAFRADVSDELGDVEALLEEAAPDYCEDCGEELPADGEDDKCGDCTSDAGKRDNDDE